MDEEINKAFSILSSQCPTDEEIQYATKTLKRLIEEPASIEFFLNCISQEYPSSIRFISSIFLRKSIIFHKDNDDEEIPDFSNVRNSLFQRLPAEPLPNIRISMCDCLSLLNNETENYAAILDYAQQLINAPNFLAEGLHLISAIYEGIEEKLRIEITRVSFDTCVQCLVSPDINLQTSAAQLLLAFFTVDTELVYVPITDAFNETLVNLYTQLMTQGGDPTLAQIVIDMIIILIQHDCVYFDDNSIELVTIAVEAIIDEPKPEIHIKAIELICEVITYQIDELKKLIPTIFEAFLILSVESLNDFLSSLNYLFINDFFQALDSTYEKKKIISKRFDQLLELIENLFEEGSNSHLITAIYALDRFFTNAAFCLENSMEFITQVIQEGLESDCDEVVDATAHLCKSFAKKMPFDFRPFSSDLVQLLLNRLDLISVNKALQVIFTSGLYNDQIDTVIDYLLDNFELLSIPAIDTLVSTLDSVQRIDEELFEKFYPICLKLYQSERHLKAQAIKTIDSLVIVSPVHFLQNSQPILQLILDSYSPYDLQLNGTCSHAIKSILQAYPDVFSNLYKDVYAKLIASFHQDMIAFEEEDEEEEECDEKVYYESRKKAFSALTALVQAYPDLYTDEVFLMLTKYSQKPSVSLAYPAITGYKRILKVVHDQALLDTFISQCKETNEVLQLGKYLTVLVELMNLDLELPIEQLQQLITAIFMHQKNVYNNKGNPLELSTYIKKPFYHFVNEFIDVFGVDNSAFLVELLVKQIQEDFGFLVVQTVAHLARNGMEINELLGECGRALMEFEEYDEDGLLALNEVVRVAPNIVDSKREELEKILDDNMEVGMYPEESAVLWFGMMEKGLIQFEDKNVERVLGRVSFGFDSEFLEFLADFVAECLKRECPGIKKYLAGIACVILGSSDFAIRRVREDTLVALGELLSVLEDGKLMQFTKFNRVHFMNIKKHMEHEIE